jgi:hypothetical protein
MKARPEAAQPLRRDLPVGVAARPAQQVDLLRQAVDERRAQLGQQRRVLACRGGQRRLEISGYLDPVRERSGRVLTRGLSSIPLW